MSSPPDRPLGRVRVQAFGLDAGDRREYREMRAAFPRDRAQALFFTVNSPEFRWAAAMVAARTADAEMSARVPETPR